MRMINLTGHDITLLDEHGFILKVFKSEGTARVNYTVYPFGWIEETDYDIEVVTRRDKIDFDGVTIEPFNVYIVSYILLRALKQQEHPQIHQFVAPSTFGVDKDEHGNVIGVTKFIVI